MVQVRQLSERKAQGADFWTPPQQLQCLSPQPCYQNTACSTRLQQWCPAFLALLMRKGACNLLPCSCGTHAPEQHTLCSVVPSVMHAIGLTAQQKVAAVLHGQPAKFLSMWMLLSTLRGWNMQRHKQCTCIHRMVQSMDARCWLDAVCCKQAHSGTKSAATGKVCSRLVWGRYSAQLILPVCTLWL